MNQRKNEFLANLLGTVVPYLEQPTRNSAEKFDKNKTRLWRDKGLKTLNSKVLLTF